MKLATLVARLWAMVTATAPAEIVECRPSFTRRHAGSIFWNELFVSAVRIDVTQRQYTEERLRVPNGELVQLANSESLTGLANRHRFDETRRAKRRGTPLSLVLLDVDQLKCFNDRYGHQGGDGCLRLISAAIFWLA